MFMDIHNEKFRPGILEEIYSDGFKISKLNPQEKKFALMHKEFFKFPVWAAIILDIITFRLFSLIFYGIQHGYFPRLKLNDPGTGKAIGFMFIPFFNVYWIFFFWLRLADRINFQLKLRNKEPAVSKVLIAIALACNFVPLLSYISWLVLMPIVVGFTQYGINQLVKK